ncbi:proteasome core particle subunit beta 2 [Hamiltosporidium tvaerminnensis]|nr:proteasome core particle subunit beta 2 [Hamiltosporidium tvaerminnensis]
MIKKTGTTIIGLKYKEGIIIASDRRATSEYVVDKNCKKLHKISPSIYAAGCGTAADIENVVRMCEKEMNIFCKKYNMPGDIRMCVNILSQHLHSYGGQIGAGLIVCSYSSASRDDGGRDTNNSSSNTSYLFNVHPHGSSSSHEYTSMGSGSLAAIGYLENQYRRGMSKEEGIDLAIKSIGLGVYNDLYSGSGVDVLVIGETVESIYVPLCKKEERDKIVYNRDSVVFIEEEVIFER